jgi:competence protein ComEC
VRRPLLYLSAAYGAGCLLASAEAGVRETLWLLGLAIVLLALALWAPSGRSAVAALGGAAFALGVAGAVVAGLRFEAGAVRRLMKEDGEAATAVRLVGLVGADPEQLPEALSVLVEVESYERGGRRVRAGGRVQVEVGGESPRPRLRVGDRIAVWTRLRPTDHAAGVRLAVTARGYCKSARLLEVVSRDEGGWLRRAAARLRVRARALLVRFVLPGPERGLVLAMTLGDRSELDERTSEAFRASGTYHVLALSGAQVALVAALLVACLRRAGASPWAQAVVTAASIGFYALLVGGDVPVVRAVLMAAAILAGRALEVDADVANQLGLAALVLLAVRPAWVTDVGFQLSFGATLGLIAFVSPLTQGLPQLPLRLELGLAASVAAQACLAPLLAFWFHRVAPGALVMNLAAVPLSGAVLLAGIGVLTASLLGAAAGELAGMLAWIAAHALRLSGDLGPLERWLDLRVPSPSAAALALHLCGLVWLARGRRTRALVALLLGHVLLVAGPLHVPVDGRLHLTVLDVGQGDALLLRSPNGRALVVDAGGTHGRRFDPGERLVGPQLWDRGVHTIDAILVTHAQLDHVAGVPFLLKAFGVREVWEGPAPLGDRVWRQLDAAVAASGAVRRSVVAGATMEWDGVRLSVLGPRPPSRPPLQGRNEDSVVLYVGFGAVDFLLTGDLEGEGLSGIDFPRVAVLKVPHHGSRSTSPLAFVEATAPRIALVSVGARNPFGHPHPEVLERYRRAGALVLRTDRDGALEVATDGQRLWVRVAGEGEERRIR